MWISAVDVCLVAGIGVWGGVHTTDEISLALPQALRLHAWASESPVYTDVEQQIHTDSKNKLLCFLCWDAHQTVWSSDA